jgi:hypothetical protein
MASNCTVTFWLLALPGIILKITGAGVENIIGRSQILIYYASIARYQYWARRGGK